MNALCLAVLMDRADLVSLLIGYGAAVNTILSDQRLVRIINMVARSQKNYRRKTRDS